MRNRFAIRDRFTIAVPSHFGCSAISLRHLSHRILCRLAIAAAISNRLQSEFKAIVNRLQKIAAIVKR
jgi:hypothetical protein